MQNGFSAEPAGQATSKELFQVPTSGELVPVGKGGFTGGPGGLWPPPKRYDFTPIEFELKRQPIHKLSM